MLLEMLHSLWMFYAVRHGNYGTSGTLGFPFIVRLVRTHYFWSVSSTSLNYVSFSFSIVNFGFVVEPCAVRRTMKDAFSCASKTLLSK